MYCIYTLLKRNAVLYAKVLSLSLSLFGAKILWRPLMLRGSWGVLIRYAKIFTYYLVIYGGYHSQIVVSHELTKEIHSGNVS